jgi:large subunit ribosomal protein L25
MEVIHVDFARVSLDEKVEVTVPVELKGTPKGEADGGVLQQIIAELEVECLVTDIPDAIRHNVSEMAIDDVLHVKDLKMPTGVRPLQDAEAIVALVKEVIEEAAPVAAEAETAEPEVIGRKPEEGEEAAAGEPEKK